MQITILKLSKTKSVNPMKAILTLSKYLKLGIPDAKGIVASLPADLNVGTLDENELNELIAALTACGIQAALTPLRLPPKLLSARIRFLHIFTIYASWKPRLFCAREFKFSIRKLQFVPVIQTDSRRFRIA